MINIQKEKGDEVYLADATLYLEYFGIICIAWQWLVQGLAAQKALLKTNKKKDTQFYKGKLATMRFYYEYELPKIKGLETRLTSDDALTVNIAADFFND